MPVTDKPQDAAPTLRTVEGHSEERFLGSDVFESSGRSMPPPRRGGTVREDAREIEVYHRCDVVVVGGGPAGCAAAWAAAQPAGPPPITATSQRW